MPKKRPPSDLNQRLRYLLRKWPHARGETTRQYDGRHQLRNRTHFFDDTTAGDRPQQRGNRILAIYTGDSLKNEARLDCILMEHLDGVQRVFVQVFSY